MSNSPKNQTRTVIFIDTYLLMKILKISGITILALALLYLAAIFTLEFIIEKKLKQEKGLSFKEFNMSFGGDFTFKELAFKNKILAVKVEDLKLNIGLMRIILSDTLLIEKASVKNVIINHLKTDVDTTQIKKTKQNKKRAFALHDVIISGLDFYSIKYKDTLTNVLGVNLKARLNDLENIQFDQLEKLNFQSMRQNTGVLNDFSIDHFNYTNHTISIDTFKLFTRYSKEEYIKYIPEQKGHIDLVASKIVLDSVIFDIRKNTLEKVNLNEINMDKFELNVYRDKTIPEYTQHEPTYAEILQSLDFELEANAMIAKNSSVSFSMKTGNQKVSRIDLKEIDARLTQINNIPSKNQLLNLTGNFSLSPTSKIDVYLAYNQYANVETFQLDVHGREIDTKSLNSMLRPALNTRIEGIVDAIDVHMESMATGAGTVRVQSENIKVKLFKENGEPRKFFTFVGNLLLHKPLDKTGEVKDFEFDKTRPMWNYIWHFTEAGIKDAVL